MKLEQVLAIFGLFLLAPIAFSQGIAPANEEFVGIISVMEPMTKVLSVLILLFGIFAGIAQQNMLMLIGSLGASIAFNSMPQVMYSILGVEPQEAAGDTNLIGGAIAWFLANWFYVGVGFTALIVEAVLIRRATRQFTFYKQETITNHWKRKLLSELEAAGDKLEDLRLVHRLEKVADSRDRLLEEQKTIAALVGKINRVKCFDHKSQPSLVGLRRELIRGKNAFEGCSGRSLGSFRETLKSMPASLEEAQRQMNKRPLYDDFLREQVSRLGRGPAFPRLSLSKAK